MKATPKSTGDGGNTPHQAPVKSQSVDGWNRYSHLFEDGEQVVVSPEKRQRAPGLIDEAPIPVYPTLAALIGINEAVTLQQIHFLLNSQRTSKNQYNFIDGRWWVYNSYHQWHVEHFPWLSESTIKRVFLWHESNGYLLSRQSVKNKSDRRKWYTIDYAKWNEFLQATIGSKWSHQPSGQNGLMVGLKESDGYSESTSENEESLPTKVGDGAINQNTDNPPAKSEVTPKKGSGKKADAVPREQFNAMLDALTSAFGYTESVWKTPKAGELRKAAKSLCEAGYTPEQVKTVYDYCDENFTHFGANAIAKYAPDAIKVVTPQSATVDTTLVKVTDLYTELDGA